MLTCKEVSHLLSQAHERSLGIGERWRLRIHLWACSGCDNFRKQLAFIRAAAGRYPGPDQPPEQ